MKKFKKGNCFIFIIFVLFLSCSSCGPFRQPINVLDTWTGPGQKDDSVTPLTPAEDAVHPLDHKNYVEHWYFDARLEGGYMVVGFLWASEMLSREPAIELHIYKPSGEKVSVTKTYAPADLRVSEEKCDVWVGHNHAYATYPDEGGLPVYHLFISEGELEADLTFYSEVPGWKPGDGKTFYGEEEFFAWTVAVPRARVEGRIKCNDEVIPARGIGYHDHNWETADLRRVVAHWYWGRLYTDEFTLLYAYVKTNGRFGKVASKPMMLAHKDKIVYSTGEMILEEGPFVFNETADREYPSGLDITVPGKVSLQLVVKDVIDANDLLKDMNPVLKWLVNTFYGRPGWFRFNSDFTLQVQIEGKTYDCIGTTLHEMVALQ